MNKICYEKEQKWNFYLTTLLYMCLLDLIHDVVSCTWETQHNTLYSVHMINRLPEQVNWMDNF